MCVGGSEKAREQGSLHPMVPPPPHVGGRKTHPPPPTCWSVILVVWHCWCCSPLKKPAFKHCINKRGRTLGKGPGIRGGHGAGGGGSAASSRAPPRPGARSSPSLVACDESHRRQGRPRLERSIAATPSPHDLHPWWVLTPLLGLSQTNEGNWATLAWPRWPWTVLLRAMTQSRH